MRDIETIQAVFHSSNLKRMLAGSTNELATNSGLVISVVINSSFDSILNTYEPRTCCWQKSVPQLKQRALIKPRTFTSIFSVSLL